MTRRRLLKMLAALVPLGAGATFFTSSRTNAYYQGPISDHFDGVRFFNPDGTGPRGPMELLRWQFLEEKAVWPKEFPSPFPFDRPPPRVDGAAVRVSYIGHASFLVQTGGRNILIDPVWSKRASPLKAFGPKRVNPPGIFFEHLPRIDLVLVSHNHYDHMDVAVLERLWRNFKAPVLTPLGNDTILRSAIPSLDVRAHDWHAAVDVDSGLRIHFEPTVHWSARGLADRRHALWSSFVIETPHRKIYCVGDSAFGSGETFRSVGRRHPGLDLALLPIGAFEPRWFMATSHMNPAESLKALGLCGAKTALGHHWGTFQLTNEPIEQPSLDLAAARKASGLAQDRFIALRPGQVHTLA